MSGAEPAPEPPERPSVLRGPPSRPTIHLLDPERRLDAHPLRWLMDATSRMAAELGPSTCGEIRVRFVGDGAMAAAHERYAGVPGTTDVLTFDYAEPGGAEGRPLDADLLVCVDEALRQSARRGHPVERELLLYMLHGALHCLGHDDHDEAAAARMHRREDEVLTTIGVGPVYLASDKLQPAGPSHGKGTC